MMKTKERRILKRGLRSVMNMSGAGLKSLQNVASSCILCELHEYFPVSSDRSSVENKKNQTPNLSFISFSALISFER